MANDWATGLETTRREATSPVDAALAEIRQTSEYQAYAAAVRATMQAQAEREVEGSAVNRLPMDTHLEALERFAAHESRQYAPLEERFEGMFPKGSTESRALRRAIGEAVVQDAEGTLVRS